MENLISVQIQEKVKIGGKVLRIYEGVIYREIFRYHHLEKVWKNCLLRNKNTKTKETI